MFRYKKSIPVSYEWQGYIYFTSLLYWELPKRTQEKILNLCIAAGKENYQALFEFVTTDAGAQAVCLRHHLSPMAQFRANHILSLQEVLAYLFSHLHLVIFRMQSLHTVHLR